MAKSIPIVSIIGRPNVGKSTLFNRFIGRRDAIVDSTAGVTRDRKYGNVSWSGHEFILVDTGGYDAKSDEPILSSVRKQALAAVDESELVLFVVDSETGITAGDEEIAKVILRQSKKVILVVNKVDDKTREPDIYDFMKLGLGEPFPISAESGRRTGDLLEETVSHFKSSPTNSIEEDEGIKIAIVGVPNVGKSSLVNRLLNKEQQIVTDIPGTTRDSADSKLSYKGKIYTLIDTAGIRRKAKIKDAVEFYSTVRARRAMDRADVIVAMLDSTRGMDKQDVHIIVEALDRRKCLVVAVNKWDLIKKTNRTHKEWSEELKDRLPLLENYPIEYISALDGQRIHKILDLVSKIQKESQKSIKTKTLNDWLAQTVGHTSPPSYNNRFVKITFVNQAKSVPPTFVFFTNYPKGIKENYKRFLEHNLRAAFGFHGVPITLLFKAKN